MANNAKNTKLTGAATTVREEDLTDLTDLSRDLANRVETARADGRIFMMAQYVRLLAMVQPEAERLRKRFDREMLSSLRKEHKELKLQSTTEPQDATA